MRLLLQGMLLLVAAGGGAQGAVEALSEHFRVLTQLGAEAAETAALHLETVRERYAALGLLGPEKDRLTVILFQDIAELEWITPRVGPHPGFTRGFYRPGTDRHYIGIAWGAEGPPGIALAHEYAHRIFQRGSYPLWFREGIAEYLARAKRVEDVVQVGGRAPGLVQSLQTQPWIPLSKLLDAGRRSEVVGQPNFYPQCWLLVHWLAWTADGLDRLRPQELERQIRQWGAASIQDKLRRHLEGPLPVLEVPAATASEFRIGVRQTESWELPYWIADLRREMGLWETARAALRRLARDQPERQGIQESLGALEMDTGNYQEAEQALAAAVALGSTNPRTHYRYSLMLMRPVTTPRASRAARAVQHARRARRLDPDEPLYLLTEAQARMLAEEWPEGIRLLARLARDPEWRERAEAEFVELERRRQQQLTRSRPPPIESVPEPPVSATFLDFQLAAVSPPPPPAPSPPTPRVSQARRSWPPPGTILLYGRIAGVECREGEKLVTIHSGYSRVRLREKASAPAKLYHPPLKWTELPCDARGWVVNAIYRPTPKDPKVSGLLVGLMF